MTDSEKREKVIRGLECCALGSLSNCEGCPYTETRCSEHLCGDALALLRKQEPRLMTLDEVLTAEDFVWAEIHSTYKWDWCICYASVEPSHYDDELVRLEDGFGIAWTKLKTDYGTKGMLDCGWRCWTSRPSEQQMRETKWEEEAE